MYSPTLKMKREGDRYVQMKEEWASSHTPRSNIAWEWCIQRIAIASISDGQSAKKGYINCSSKGSNQHFLQKCISTHYVLHNYKVSGNSVEWFQRSCANNKSSSIFHFGQISKFKKGVTPRKKMESKFPVDMGIYTSCSLYLQSFTKFCWAVSEELR